MISSKTFSDDFFSLMECSYAFSEKHGVSELSISTITMIAVLNVNNINMEIVANNLHKHLEIEFVMKNKKRTDKPLVTKRGKEKRAFFNQITISFKDGNQKSIKIFTNGKLQMTGITSFVEGMKISSMLAESISACIHTPILVKDLYIGMINSDFCFRKRVKMRLSCEILRNMSWTVSYEPDTYPGLKIKFQGVSILIFETGNVIITGGKTLNGIRDAFVFICNFFNDNDLLFSSSIEKKKKEKIIDGYRKSTFDCCIIKSHD